MKTDTIPFTPRGHIKPSHKSLQRWVALVSAAMTMTVGANAADIVWQGAATGDWNTAGNWSPAQVPGAADNAVITNSGTFTVTLSANSPVGSVTVGGTSGTQTLDLGRFNLTLNGPNTSVVSANGHIDMLLNCAILGSGNLTVNGTLNWSNGALNAGGVITIGSGGVLAIGPNNVTLARTVNNGGAATWVGGNLAMSAGSAFNNLAGGTLDITADGRLGTTTAAINNSGLVRQTAGTAGTTIGAQFNNSGTVQVQALTLGLNNGGTHSGTFSNAPSATLALTGGSHVLTSSSLVTGAGSLALSGGATTLAASGTFDAGTTLSVTAGTVTLAAGCVVTGTTLNINSGILNYDSAGSVGVVNLNGGTLGGTSPVNVTGLLTLAGGTVTNSMVIANAGLNINGGGFILNGGKLVNPGLAVWSAGNFTGANGAVFSNLFGATFINTFDGNAPSGAGATPTFINAGVFQKTNGTAALGATAIDFNFINTGTVEVRTNTLNYNFNQQTAGLTLLDGGALSGKAGGGGGTAQPIQILGGSLVGTGLVTVANTAHLINSAAISPGLPLGELDLSGDYQQTSSGALNIEVGGYVPGTGFDLVAITAGGAGGVATLGGALNVTLTNGFSPTNGASFTFLTALSRVGTFSSFNYPSNDIGMTVSYDLTSAKVTVSNLKPVVANPIGNPAAVTYGAAFDLQFAANTFSDPDNDALTYTAFGMPPGITFSGATRTFSGDAGQVGAFPVAVVATDNGIPSLSVTNTFTITVNPAPLSVSANAQTKTYGAADPALTYTVSGFQFTDTQASVVTGALTRAAGESVAGSPYEITQGTVAANGNYSISFTGSTLAITPATLTVMAQSKSKVYGAADPALTFTVAGLQFSDTAAVVAGALSRAVGETVAGSPYAITQGALVANDNYSISFTGSTLAITPATLTVTAQDKSKTYGAAEPALTFTASGFQFTDTQAGVMTGALTRAAGETVAGSPYAITQGTVAANGNYTISFTANTLVISPATLTVTPQAASKVYGAADPALTFTVSGLQFSDTAAVVTGSLARAAGETVAGSPYAITQGTLGVNGNYTINFTGSTLAITPATLTVTALAKSKTYGAVDPALTSTVSGLQFSDTAAVVTGSLARAAGETVAGSPYAITQGTVGVNANYTISFTGSTLTITPAPLVVVAADATRGYGQTNPVFTASYTGFVNGETNTVLGGTLALSTLADTNSPVGNYAITGSGLTASDYSITYPNGTLTVLPQALTVTAQDKSKIYGAADPVFTGSYTGLVNGQSSTVLGGTLTFSRAAGENVGTYTITPAGLTSTNYAITFANGTLTIDKATLTVAAQAKSKTYGAADPVLTYTVSGLQFSDTAAVVTGSLARAAGETVAGSPYAITQGTVGVNANYTISFTGSTLAITPATLTVTAQSKSKTYGVTLVLGTSAFTTSGLQNGESVGAVTLTASGSPAGTAATAAAGPYTITPSAATGGTFSPANYAITYATGTLTVNPAALTVTASAQNKTYGATLVLGTSAFTVSGLQNGETVGSVTLTASGSPAGTAATAGAGPYAITPSAATGGTFSPANYTISYATGTLTVNKAALSVTADDKTKTHGSADPTFTVTYAGFVNSDTSAALGGALTITRAPGETVGSYPITPSGLTSTNYMITFNAGTLTITASEPLILALTSAGPTDVVITWSAVSNATYRVQYKGDLSATNWTDLIGDVLAAGGTASKTDIKTTSNRFYRIQVVP